MDSVSVTESSLSTMMDVQRQPRSWVFLQHWAEKRKDPKSDKIFAHCLFPTCNAKFAVVRGGTTGIAGHLQSKHHVTREVVNDGTFPRRRGVIDALIANAGKRPAENFSRDDFLDAISKFLVSRKLPFNLVNDPMLQQVINLAQLASSKDEIKLPSNDTISRKVSTTPHP